jgi:hypothetical protein
MSDRVLQNHYCVAVLQHRLAYNVTMSPPAGMRTFKEARDGKSGVRGIFAGRFVMSANVRILRIAAVALALGCAVCLAACGSKPAVTSLGCPSPAVLAPATGSTFGAPKVSRTSVSLSCSYEKGETAIGLTIHKRDVSINQFQAAQQEAASARHQTAAPLDGYGSAAYIVTSPSGNGATELTMLTQSDTFTLVGTLSAARTKAIARCLLSNWLTRHEHFSVHIPL